MFKFYLYKKLYVSKKEDETFFIDLEKKLKKHNIIRIFK